MTWSQITECLQRFQLPRLVQSGEISDVLVHDFASSVKAKKT